MDGQSYLLGCANVHPHLTHVSLDPPESPSQTISRSVQPFCTAHSKESLCFTIGRSFPAQNFPLHIDGSGPPTNTWFLEPTPAQNRFSRFCRAHDCDRQTDRPR